MPAKATAPRSTNSLALDPGQSATVATTIMANDGGSRSLDTLEMGRQGGVTGFPRIAGNSSRSRGERTMVWSQVYDPLNNAWLSTLIAALPVIVLLAGLGVFRMKAHTAALLGLAVSLAAAVFVFGMPVEMAGKTAL